MLRQSRAKRTEYSVPDSHSRMRLTAKRLTTINSSAALSNLNRPLVSTSFCVNTYSPITSEIAPTEARVNTTCPNSDADSKKMNDLSIRDSITACAVAMLDSSERSAYALEAIDALSLFAREATTKRAATHDNSNTTISDAWKTQAADQERIKPVAVNKTL